MSLDAVGLEVMEHAFASVAEEMGLVLIHSAVSPNIRERRDCSAALFDAAGEMIAQAAHIPVHLGAMHESVAAVRALVPAPRPGDVFILNDPYTRGPPPPHIPPIRAIEGDGAAVRGAATDLLDYAERRARDALGRFTATALTATDWLEGDGVDDADLAITVRVDITDGVFHVDFTGTAQAARGNVNCPLAVARSAVLFVVRTLLPGDIPTNGGVQRAVRVTAPLGCLVNARYPSAVAAGNVETSQRIADTVLLALAAGGISVPAQGQGTMNNVTLGAGAGAGAGGWAYYETVGG